MSDIPKIPTYHIKTTLNIRDRLLSGPLFPIEGQTLVSTDFEYLVKSICEELVSVPYSTLYESMITFAGITITKPMISELAWRLAGNLHSLRKGNVVVPYVRQLCTEWVPLQIRQVTKTYVRTKEGAIKNAGIFDFLVLGGSPTGLIISKKWIEGYCYMTLTKKIFGFAKYNMANRQVISASKPTFPLTDITEFTNLRMFGLITPEICKQGPNFEEIAGTQTTRKWNKNLFKLRTRTDYKCPQNYDISYKPCYNCELGYKSCKAACHSDDYIQLGKQCLWCKQPNKYYSKDQLDICVGCTAKKTLKNLIKDNKR